MNTPKAAPVAVEAAIQRLARHTPREENYSGMGHSDDGQYLLRSEVLDCIRAELARPLGVEVTQFDDWPDFNEQAMGCGLEDKNITDRYEAMRYGWDEAMERVGERFEQFIAARTAPAGTAPLSQGNRDQGHLSVAESGLVQGVELVENLRDTLACCQNWADPEHDDDSTEFPALQVSRAIGLADSFLATSAQNVALQKMADLTHELGLEPLAAQPTTPAPEQATTGSRQDSERLDYLQKRGATVSIVRTGGSGFAFQIGGLHVAKNPDVRAAIDAAILSSTSAVSGGSGS